MKRAAEAGPNTTWRPKKRYRLSAAHWCLNMDNQIRQSLGLNGFADFIPKVGVPWRKRRHVNIAVDQGSDGLCAANWLLAMKVCMTLWCDFSHGATNDVTSTIKAMGLWSFFLLMLVTLNLEHGPWDCDTRHAQVQEGWAETASIHTSSTSVLFQHHLPNMIYQLRHVLEKMDFIGPVDNAVFDMTHQEPLLKKKGYKKRNARFMDLRRGLKELLPKWSVKCCQYEHVAIEMGMVSQKQIEKLKKGVAPAIKETQDPNSTSAAVLTLDDKVVRGTCQNALVISVAMLSEGSHYHLCAIVVACTEPVDSWHSTQNKALRSEAESIKWVVKQLEGDFWKHCRDILGTMRDVKVLASVGITQCEVAFPDKCDMLIQDELAEVHGDFALLLSCKRVGRSLWFIQGLPHRLGLVLSKKHGVAQDCLKEFKLDFECYEACKEAAKTCSASASFERRSIFHHSSVQLHVEVCFKCILCCFAPPTWYGCLLMSQQQCVCVCVGG